MGEEVGGGHAVEPGRRPRRGWSAVRWIALGVVVTTVGAGMFVVFKALHSDVATVRNRLRDIPQGQVFQLAQITPFEWDTLYVYGPEQRPLTGQTRAITEQIPQDVIDTLVYESEDSLFLFTAKGRLAKAIPVSPEYTFLPITSPRPDPYPADTRFVQTHCPGFPHVLLTVDARSGAPTTCP